MVIGIVTATLSIPSAHSLKEKRSVVRSVKDRAMNTMNVSVAEVGGQDTWQRAEMAFVTVAANSTIVQKRVSDIDKFLRSNPRYVLSDLRTEML